MKTLKVSFPLLFILKKVWQNLASNLIKSSELQVWSISDGRGHFAWRAYDPDTGRSTCFGSEAEMRVWIEQDYYQ